MTNIPKYTKNMAVLNSGVTVHIIILLSYKIVSYATNLCWHPVLIQIIRTGVKIEWFVIRGRPIRLSLSNCKAELESVKMFSQHLRVRITLNLDAL